MKNFNDPDNPDLLIPPLSGHKARRADTLTLSGSRAPAPVYMTDRQDHYREVELFARERPKPGPRSPTRTNPLDLIPSHRPGKGVPLPLLAAQLHTPPFKSDFPTQGYLEYLGLSQPDARWTPPMQARMNGWSLQQMADLMGMSRHQYAGLENWMLRPEMQHRSLNTTRGSGVPYSRVKAKQVYDLCAGLGVPLSGVLQDAYERDQQKLPSLGGELAISMLKTIRPLLVDFDRWVFDNLTSNFYSVLDPSGMRRVPHRQHRWLWGEQVFSSYHNSLTEEQLRCLPADLRLIIRQLKVLLRERPPTSKANFRANNLLTLDEQVFYWESQQEHLYRVRERLGLGAYLKLNRAELERLSSREQDYYSQTWKASDKNGFDTIFGNFPLQSLDFTKAMPLPATADAKACKGLVPGPVTALLSEHSAAYVKAAEQLWAGQEEPRRLPISRYREPALPLSPPLPAQAAWAAHYRARLEKAAQDHKAHRWMPFHRHMLGQVKELAQLVPYTVQPGVWHGAWRWLGEIASRLNQVVIRLEQSGEIDFTMLLKAREWMPDLGVLDVDKFTAAVHQLEKMPGLKQVVSEPTRYWMVKTYTPTTQAMLQKPLLYPPKVRVLRGLCEAAGYWEWEEDLRALVLGTMVGRGAFGPSQGPERTDPGSVQRWRACWRIEPMRVQHPSWVDVLWHRYLAPAGEEMNLIPASAGVLDSQGLMARTEEVLQAGVVDLVQLDALPLVQAGASFVGRQWVLSPGTVAQVSVVSGSRTRLLNYRTEVLEAAFAGEPMWRDFMHAKWRYLDDWFSCGPAPAGPPEAEERFTSRPWWTHAEALGSHMRTMTLEKDHSRLTHQLCDSPGSVSTRLVPLLRFLHIPLPVFLRWMMVLREQGREVEACHYYIDNRTWAREGRKLQPAGAAYRSWNPPCQPGEQREHDQLRLVFEWYWQACEVNQVEVLPGLDAVSIAAWWDGIEAAARAVVEQHKQAEVEAAEQRRVRQIAQQREEDQLADEAERAQARMLAELEGFDDEADQ